MMSGQPSLDFGVEDRDAEIFRARDPQAGFLCGVFERAVAAVCARVNGSAFVRFGRAVGFRFSVEDVQ